MPKAKYNTETIDGVKYYFYNVPREEYDEKGRRKYKRLRARTVKALDEKIEKYKVEEAARLAAGTVNKDITLNEWYKQWFKVYKGKCEVTTKNYYESLYRLHIQPVIGSEKVADIREVQLQDILNEVGVEHAQSTVKGVRTVMSSMFEKAVNNHIITISPAAGLKLCGKKAKTRRELTTAERAAYLATCETHPFGKYAAILYFFGLRRGEALALTGADITAEYIRVNKQYVFPDNNQPLFEDYLKTDAGERLIPIPEKARPFLQFDRAPGELLFRQEDGSPYSYSPFIDRWKSFITEALGEETEITPHYVRHNYCTMLFEADVAATAAKELMGHASIKTTLEIYAHCSEKLQAKENKKILSIG